MLVISLLDHLWTPRNLGRLIDLQLRWVLFEDIYVHFIGVNRLRRRARRSSLSPSNRLLKRYDLDVLN